MPHSLAVPWGALWLPWQSTGAYDGPKNYSADDVFSMSHQIKKFTIT